MQTFSLIKNFDLLCSTESMLVVTEAQHIWGINNTWSFYFASVQLLFYQILTAGSCGSLDLFLWPSDIPLFLSFSFPSQPASHPGIASPLSLFQE
jgi:hypothetical protein